MVLIAAENKEDVGKPVPSTYLSHSRHCLVFPLPSKRVSAINTPGLVIRNADCEVKRFERPSTS